MTLTILGVVFCVAFGYVALVVKVAVSHWPITTSDEKQSMEYSDGTIKTAQERWKNIKKERGLDYRPPPPTNDIKKENPFHKHNLGTPLRHGVKPEALLNTPKEDLPVAAKKDIDIQHHPTPEHVLTAYQEVVNFDEWDTKPLPIRTATAQASKLNEIQYSRLNSCSKLPQQWPVDDSPVDVDSFLPWIHDVFPSADGTVIQIVAQNKRRCKNGSKEKDILHQQQPQASLFQHVSLKRLQPSSTQKSEPRFRLASHEDADSDSVVTRFLCRFKPDMSVTASTFNFDYDWTAYRKKYKASFREDDAGIKAIHSTQLIFQCPVPKHLQEIVRKGSSVKDDWATLFLDVIPVRTPPRFGIPNQYFPPQYKSFQSENSSEIFDSIAAWGVNHVLPLIKDSGRWENIPICMPSLMTYEGQKESDLAPVAVNDEPLPPPVKKHRLVSCIWASAGYSTRGNRFAINDGQRRLLEWITYNKIVGFDHFYVYDNSGAFSDEISLKPVVDLFPGYVTYIPWPSQICNNNPNNVDSAGERSSQYAAESSCRLRFGPHVDWIGQFDIDEYLVPMGEYKTVTSLLDKLDKEDTRIISFASWRAWPRRAHIEEPVEITDPDICWSNEPCFDLKIPLDRSMLQAYNCDRQPPGKKNQLMPAEKQLYRADYVVQHFVHYTVATKLSEKNQTEYSKEGFGWRSRAFPDPRQRFGNELTEGLMIHTKAVARQDTAGWKRMCHINNTFLPIRRQGLCRLGVPFPSDWSASRSISNATTEGWAYNCYVNEKLENDFVPELNKQLKLTASFFETQ